MNNNKTENVIKNRYELLFLYDIRFWNPNWDPSEENDLRLINDRCFVTDVRLKRTIRDYLIIKWENVLIKEERENDKVKTLEKLIEEAGDEILKNIDIRLFWLALKYRRTWPVQFNYWISLHDIKHMVIEWTTVVASSENKSQWTFTRQYVTPYALIWFNWIVNQNVAEYTRLTDEDVSKLLEAMWLWTKNLITRSKYIQKPRLLLVIKYKEWFNSLIWDLDLKVKLECDDIPMNVNDYKLDINELVEIINKYKDKIEEVKIYKDNDLRVNLDKFEKSENNEFNDIEMEVYKLKF